MSNLEIPWTRAWVWPEDGGGWRARTEDGRHLYAEDWQSLVGALTEDPNNKIPPHEIAVWRGPHLEEIFVPSGEATPDILYEAEDGQWVEAADLLVEEIVDKRRP